MKTTFQLLGIALFIGVFSFTLAAQNPHLSIQGTLKDANGASVADGSYSVTFKLYNALEGGSLVWQEESPVEVVGGIYSHLLGSVTPLSPADFGTTLYLGVKIGTYELTPRTELSYAPYAFSVAAAQTVVCSGAVGDIKHSILNPTQFAQVNGDCWVPMDGRNIAGTQLASLLGVSTVPDMSGLFIRATEYNDGNDPGRSPMAAAGLQGDDNKTHNHTMAGAGEHAHNYDDSYLSNVSQSGTDQGSGAGVNVPRNGTSGWLTNFFSDDSMNFTNTQSTHTTVTTPAHTHTIDNSGGNEARPKNMNFYIYIRVD